MPNAYSHNIMHSITKCSRWTGLEGQDVACMCPAHNLQDSLRVNFFHFCACKCLRYKIVVVAAAGKGPTMLLVKDKQGQVFGGYASEPWLKNGKFYGDVTPSLYS